MPRRVDVIELSMGYQEYLTRTVRRGTRQNVAKAARNGVEIECDTTGRLIPVFYDLYLSWVERWIPRSGLPPALARHSALKQEPYTKFETVAALMGDRCRVFVAWHEGRAVASCINFVHGEHAIGWRSYSIKELAGPVAANTATQVAGIRNAMESGCRFFDLGQSGDVSNLQSYKNSLGATPRQVVDLRIEPPLVARARTAAAAARPVSSVCWVGWGGRRSEHQPEPLTAEVGGPGRNHGSRPTRPACHQISARAMPVQQHRDPEGQWRASWSPRRRTPPPSRRW